MKKVWKWIKSKFYIFVLMLAAYFMIVIGGMLHDFKPQLAEDSWQGYIDWGRSLSYSGYYDAGVRAVETAIEKEPENVEGYLQLAEVHLENKEFQKAREVYNQAISACGETYELKTKLEDVDNVDVQNISAENSKGVSKENVDSPRYDTNKEYNSNGDVVYIHNRPRMYSTVETKTTYEYDDDNKLLRETQYDGWRLRLASEYLIYEYDDNDVLTSKTECDYTGHKNKVNLYKASGEEYQEIVYNQDNSYCAEEYDAEGNIISKEYYDKYDNKIYYVKYEPYGDSSYFEKAVYNTSEDEMMYYALLEYNSSLKTVKREFYYTPEDEGIVVIRFEQDTKYHVYVQEGNNKETEVLVSEFYEEALACAQQYLPTIE